MIVFVHGLWLTGIESAWLRRRLSAELHMEAHAFHYRSVSDTLDGATAALREFILARRAETAHLVAHSLGGILVLRLLERHTDIPPGRVVLLGVPVSGSTVAQRLSRWRWGASALGQLAGEELARPHRRVWKGSRELGVIAGSQPLGLGRIIAELPHPHDGTVAVEETVLEGAADHLVLPVSHTGMQFSASVARQTANFLEHGKFARSSQAD